MRLLLLLLASLSLFGCRNSSAPPLDTHSLAEEVHHKPDVARLVIRQLIAEHHGVTMIAEELGKNAMAATTVVDALMQQPAIAEVIEDRCEAARIAREVNRRDSR